MYYIDIKMTLKKPFARIKFLILIKLNTLNVTL